jgi:uncharacterized phage protein (TIGR02218 family)
MTGSRDFQTSLFKFAYQGSFVTYCSGDIEVVYLGDTYAPIEITRSAVEAEGDVNRQNLTITLPIDNADAVSWFQGAGDNPLTVTVFSYSQRETYVEWKGRLTSIAPGDITIDFIFESVFTSMRRSGLRQNYQLSCPYALYGYGCGLNKDDFANPGSVTLVSQNIITVTEAAGFETGYFIGGIFKDNQNNLRFIIDHSGDQITLIRPISELIAYVVANGYSGLTCTLYPGCDRSIETCEQKFDNVLNHGGFPFIPSNNPFDGGSII